MEYIPESLVQEIIDKAMFVRVEDAYERTLKSEKLERKALQKMAQVHSFKMEHPHTIVPYSVPKNGHKKSIRKGVINLRRAFRWACENLDLGNFDASFLRGVNGRIFPGVYEGDMAPYRDMGTTISGSSVTPPYPAKLITKEIPNFESAVRERVSKNPGDLLELAIYIHYHTSRMHPFYDGNGRTARIVQDAILDSTGLPPPIIEAGERETYYQLLRGADVDWKRNKNWENEDLVTPGEKLFYTFMAGKVNSSLDKLVCAIR